MSVELDVTSQQIVESPTIEGEQESQTAVSTDKSTTPVAQSPSTITVDAALWHKLVYLLMTHAETLVTGGYTPQARLLMLGRIRGGQTTAECTALWDESKKFITELNRPKESQ